MDRANRLLPEQHTRFLHRMELARMQARIDQLSSLITQEKRNQRHGRRRWPGPGLGGEIL